MQAFDDSLLVAALPHLVDHRSPGQQTDPHLAPGRAQGATGLIFLLLLVGPDTAVPDIDPPDDTLPDIDPPDDRFPIMGCPDLCTKRNHLLTETWTM